MASNLFTNSAILLIPFIPIVAIFLHFDYFHLSPISSVKFHPHNYSDIHPPSESENHLLHSISLNPDSTRRFLEGSIFGPESNAFDIDGSFAYSGISDGRIIKWNYKAASESAATVEFQTFGTTSALWNSNCTLPKAGPNLKLEHICGRPLGLRLCPATKRLYVADAYFGLMFFRPEGGTAEPLVAEADGVPFRFTNDLDLDSHGNIYFTDSSHKYQRRQFLLEILEGGSHGRLLQYNIHSKATTVLLSDLRFPNGVALSADESFLLFCETSLMRIQKYWLKGPKAGTAEVVTLLPGFPDNIRLNPRGHFWVGIHAKRNLLLDYLFLHPRLRHFILSLPVNLRLLYLAVVGPPHGIIAEVDGDGKVVRVLEDKLGTVVKAVSEVEEIGGHLWFGSVLMPFLSVSSIV